MRRRLGAVLALVLLCGCASQQLSMRTLPPQTPAADAAGTENYGAELAADMALEASSTQGAPAAAGEAPFTPADAPSMQTFDPWERTNRFIYRFNARVDEHLLLPIANGYRRLPGPLQQGVHNFFGNLGEINSVLNYTLQWRLRLGLRSFGRFLLNSTFGVAGLFDVAERMKLGAAPTGLSTTLAAWGMHPGPYLVIPFLGPSTVRDGVGLVGDYGVAHVANVAHLYRGNEAWALGATTVVDQRARSDFRYYSTGSPFEYEEIRFFYVRKRLLEEQALHPAAKPARPDADVPAGK
jgi:phospholipid-binding lipoprotein MlaA